MTGAIESKDKHWVPAQAVPNYGLVYPLDKGLQKQLEDLKRCEGLITIYQNELKNLLEKVKPKLWYVL